MYFIDEGWVETRQTVWKRKVSYNSNIESFGAWSKEHSSVTYVSSYFMRISWCASHCVWYRSLTSRHHVIRKIMVTRETDHIICPVPDVAHITTTFLYFINFLSMYVAVRSFSKTCRSQPWVPLITHVSPIATISPLFLTCKFSFHKRRRLWI